MEEAVAAAVGFQAPAQIVPALDLVHRLILDQFLQDDGRSAPVDAAQHQKTAIEPGGKKMREIGRNRLQTRDPARTPAKPGSASRPECGCHREPGSTGGTAPGAAVPPPFVSGRDSPQTDRSGKRRRLPPPARDRERTRAPAIQKRPGGPARPKPDKRPELRRPAGCPKLRRVRIAGCDIAQWPFWESAPNRAVRIGMAWARSPITLPVSKEIAPIIHRHKPSGGS